jgi:molybdate/tungstate transport system substrate-binding protein
MRATVPPTMRPCLLLLACALASGCEPRRELVVFHASSLSRVFDDLARQLEARQPRLVVRLEPSGSQVAARKVSEQGLRADVVAVADDAILRRLLVPAHAPEVVVFATNELVLAHLAHSQGTEEVSEASWPQVLERDGVRLGRVDEDLAPLGYHTLLAWQLAEAVLGAPGLAGRLRERCARQHVTHDEAELLALLEARALDYAFLYRSTAEDHRLKVTRLPDTVNLSRPEAAASYARASVEVTMASGQPPVRVAGRAITAALAVPADAPNPAAARAFVELLSSEVGRRTLERHGFHPVPR